MKKQTKKQTTNNRSKSKNNNNRSKSKNNNNRKKGMSRSNRKIPKHYLPKGLTKKDRAKQLKSIIEGVDRPKVASGPKYKKSRHVVKFEKKYATLITDDKFIRKNIIKQPGIEQILNKGRGAYYSSGSRPNVTAEQWARARLAAVITDPKGGARRVDRKIWDEYSI